MNKEKVGLMERAANYGIFIKLNPDSNKLARQIVKDSTLLRITLIMERDTGEVLHFKKKGGKPQGPAWECYTCFKVLSSESLMIAHYKESHCISAHFQWIPFEDGKFYCPVKGCDEPRRTDKRILSCHLNMSREHSWD